MKVGIKRIELQCYATESDTLIGHELNNLSAEHLTRTMYFMIISTLKEGALKMNISKYIWFHENAILTIRLGGNLSKTVCNRIQLEINNRK